MEFNKSGNEKEKLTLLNNPRFAYFMGFFTADGSFYKDSSGTRFEFSDGTSVKRELKYSYEFLNSIKKIIYHTLNIKTPDLRKKGNKFVLSFRSKKLSGIFNNYFNMESKPKTFSADIPHFYINNGMEKYFWLGVMDGDGMIARDSRKISLESMSERLIKSFKSFLDKNQIINKYSVRELNENKAHRIFIQSNFIKDYANILGFNHPRKREWLNRHLEGDYYINSSIDISGFETPNGIINYEKVLDSENIFIVDGKSLLRKHGVNNISRDNVQFKLILKLLKNLDKEELFEILSNYRWKLSKGSTNSVKMPTYFTKEILEIAKYIRLRAGGVGLSPNYIKSFDVYPDKIVKNIENIFDIKAKYTSRNEPIFCSGVLNRFFSKIIKRKVKKYIVPNLCEELQC